MNRGEPQASSQTGEETIKHDESESNANATIDWAQQSLHSKGTNGGTRLMELDAVQCESSRRRRGHVKRMDVEKKGVGKSQWLNGLRLTLRHH